MSDRIAWLKRLSTSRLVVAPHCPRGFSYHRPSVFEIYGFISFNFVTLQQPASDSLRLNEVISRERKVSGDNFFFKQKFVSDLLKLRWITNSAVLIIFTRMVS